MNTSLVQHSEHILRVVETISNSEKLLLMHTGPYHQSQKWYAISFKTAKKYEGYGQSVYNMPDWDSRKEIGKLPEEYKKLAEVFFNCSRDKIVLENEWGCENPANPHYPSCIFDEEYDRAHDSCLYCGQPTERK